MNKLRLIAVRGLWLIALPGLLVGQTQSRGVTELPPVDQADSVPGLVAVREAAAAALKSRNFDALSRVVADDVTVLASRQAGKRAFRLAVDSGLGDSLIADLMLAALNLGGSFTTSRGSVPGRREFCAPYTYSAFPKDFAHYIRKNDEPVEFDPWVLTAKDVAVRQRPGSEAPVVARLSYRLVFITRPSIGEVERGLGWYGVATG